MARLTWEQVQAPNFNGVLDGLVASSRLIGNAFGQAREGIEDLRKTQTNLADNAVTSELLKYQGNPDALTADLGSGAFQSRVDMSKISGAMREHLAKAPAELLKFASDKSSFDQGQKAITDRDFFRANNGLVNQYLDLERLGTAEQRDAFKKANPDFFAKANFGLLSELSKTGQLSQGTDTRNRSDLFNLGKNSTEFGWQTDDRQAEQSATTMYQKALAEGGGERWLNQNKASLIEKFGDAAFNRAIAKFQGGGGGGSGSFSGFGGGSGGAVGGGGSINIGDAQMSVAQTLKQGGLSDHVIAGFMGNFEVEGGYTGGQGDGGTAGGIAQWREGRRDKFKAMFGKDPTAASHAEQAQYVLWELTTPEGRKSAGISDDKAQAILNAPDAATAAALIDEHYERSDGTHRQRRVEAANAFVKDPRRAQVTMNTSMQQALSGDPNVRVATRFSEGWNDSSNITQVAARLTGKGGTFEGETADYVAEQVRQVRDKYGVNDAVAGAILAEAREGRQGQLYDYTDWLPWSDGLKSNINWDKADQMAALAKDRTGLARTMVGISDKQTAMAGMQQTNAQLAQIEAAYRNEQMQAAATGRRVDHAYWQGLITAAKGAQGQAYTGAVPSAMDGAPAPAPVRRSHQAPSRQVQPVQNPVVAQANGIMRLGGKIREKQAAAFQARYGVSPAEAIDNPSLIQQRGSSDTVQLADTPTRGQLIIDANAALLQGAAAIAAFQKRYGQHPRVFTGM